jgi:hypothetical protein
MVSSALVARNRRKKLIFVLLLTKLKSLDALKQGFFCLTEFKPVK